jgi:GNAT superfamily N-acetyltransferase
LKVDVFECGDSSSLIELFNVHKDEPFTYLADTQLFSLFSKIDFCRVFEAKADRGTVGSIYAMKHMYDCGWIGGLLVHKEFRRKGVGRKLLGKALDWLDTPYAYAFVEPENTAAQELFKSMGFNTVYRRLNYKVQMQNIHRQQGGNETANTDLQWSELTEAEGYKERGGVVNLGYYPVKLTEEVFDDLKSKKKVLRLGDIIAIVEISYVVNLDGYDFIFSNHILDRVPLPTRNKVVEVNPFYVRRSTSVLIELLKNLAGGEVMIWTYEGDPVASELTFEGTLGALVLSYVKT